MNTPLRHLLALAAGSLLAVSSAPAQTPVNWEGDDLTSNLWATAANWDAAPTSDLTANIANFNLASYGTNPVWAPTVGTATSIAGITIGSSNGAMTLTTGGFLTIGASGISIANGAGAFTLSGSTTLGAAQAWTNSSANPFTFGTVSNGTNLLTIDGSGNSIATGDIGSGSSSGGLTKNGAGKFTLQAASTRTGATVIDGGTLRIENATAFGTTAAAITINNGGTFEIGTSTALAATTSTGTINLNNGGTISSGLAGAAARIDKTINLQASATGVFTFDSGSNASNVLTINGGNNSRLAGGATGAQIQITGSGIVDVGEAGQTRTTAVTADWYLQGGRLRMRADSEIGAAANDFHFQGGTLLTDAAFALGTSRVLNFNHASGGTVDTTGGNLTLGTAGQLNGANRLTKAGSNSLVISAANTGFSGGVTFNGGTVQANHATALGSSGNLTFSGGTLQYTANSAVTDWAARIKNSSSAIILDSNGQTISLAGIIDNTNVGGLTKTGAGTLQLSGANTYTGTTTVTQGILSLDFTGGSNRINSGNALQLGGGTLQFTELGTNTQTFGSTTLNSATASSITRSGAYTSGVSDLGTLSGSGTLDVSNLTVSPTWIKASGNVSQTYLLNGLVTANSGASFVRTDASGNLFTVATSDFANNAVIGNNPGTSIRLVAGGSAGTGPTGSGFVGLSTVGTTDFDSILNRYTSGTVTIDVTNSGANPSNILRLGSYGPMSSSFGAALTVGTDVANGGFLTAGGADDTAGTIYVNGSNNTTINSVIQNNGTGVVGLNKDGSGTLTLAGTNTYTGGTTINAGTLQGTTTSTSLTPPNPLGSGAITLNGSGTVLQLRASGTLNTTAETIQFDNNVTVGGDATIDVNRPGATSTTKAIQLGTLSIGANTLGVTGGNSYALRFNGATTLTGNATFNVANIYNNNPSLTLAGAVGDGSAGYSLTKTGAGILALSGNNTFSGGVFINAGTLRIASAANLGDSANIVTFTGAGTLESSSTTTLTQGFAINPGVTGTLYAYDKTVTINNSLAGSGNLKASGGGTGGGYFEFTSTNNTFSGNIEINSASGGSYAGGLTLASLDDTPGTRIKMSNTSSFTYGAGAVAPLVLDNRQIESVGWEFGSSLNNNATLASSTVTVNTDLLLSGGAGNRPFTLGGSNTGNNTFAGAITNGAGGYVTRLTKAGAGRWILSNTNNSYTGPTTINGGTLSINSITNVGAGTSAVGAPTTVANGTIAIGTGGTAGTLQYTGGAATTDRVINLAGSTGGAILDQSGTGLLKFTSDFTATVAGTKTLTLQGSTAGTGEIAGAIVNGSGTTALAKAGTGTWTLSGTSSFTGGTTVSAGTLVLGHATDTLANTGAVTVNGTGVLSIGGNSDTVGAVTLAGGSITGTGGTLTGTSYAVQSGSVSAKLGGAVTLTKTTTGTVTLSGANTYTGGTIVNAGNLTLAFGGIAANIISPSSALTMGGGTLQLTGTGSQTFNGLTTTSSTNSAIVLGADQTLTLGALTSAGAGSYLNFNTTAGGANGATVGSGIVVLTGRTPGNVINAGYTVTDAGGFGLATVNESNQVIRLAAGTLLPPSGATSGNNYFVDNNAGGPAAAGSSSLVVSATQAAASVTVDTTASSGTLTLNSGFFMESNLWNFGGGVGANSYTINGPGSLRSVASGNTITLNNYNTGLVTIAAPIAASGTNPVTLTGSGTTVFSGNNTYTGLTTVSAGVLIIQHNNALGTTAGGVNVATGAALQMQNNITVGNEALTLNGTGIGNTGALRNISGSNTYGGLVTLGSATRINSDAGTLTLDVSSGSAFTGTHNLTIGGAGNVTVADPVGTGAGILTKDGAGILTLNAVNTYTGLTTVSDGTLVLGHATNTLAGGPVTVNGAGAVLSIGNNTDTVGVVTLVSGSISGTGGTLTGTSYAMQSGSASANLAGGGTVTLTKSTSGIVTLSGTNTYTGTTTVTGGVLRLNSANALPGGIASTGGSSALTLNGGVVGLGAGDFNRGTGTTAEQVQWTGSGGFAPYGGDRSVNLGGATATVTWAAGNFVPNAGSLILGAADSANLIDFQNPINLAGASRTVQVDNGSAGVDARLSATLSNGGLAKTGLGTLELTAANSFGGATLVSAGVLHLAGANGAIASSSGVTVSSGGTLRISNTDVANNTNRLNDAGPVTLSGSGVLDFSHTGGAVNYSETAGALIITGSGSRVITSQAADGQTSTLTFASLANGGGVQFEGNGLGANNRNRVFITAQVAGAIAGATHYDPLTAQTNPAAYTLANGVGPLSSDANVYVVGGVIPDGSAAVSIVPGGPGGYITLSAATTTINSLTQKGDQLATVYMDMPVRTLRTNLVLLSNANSPLTLGVDPGVGFLAPKTASGTLTLNNNYSGTPMIINAVVADNGSGSSMVKTGAGTVQIAAGATYTGSTGIGAGTVTLTGAGALPDASAVDLSDPSSVLHLSGISASVETIGSLTGVSGSSVVLGPKTLGLNGISPAPFAGVISGSGGSLALLAGAQQTITGDNTFTGDVTIGANATLSVNKIETSGAQPLGQGTSAIELQGNVGVGATLTYSGAGAGETNRGLNLSGGVGGTVNVTAGTLTVNGTLSGTASFRKAGAGKLVLSGGESWNADGFVNGGTLVLGGDSSPGSNSLTGGNWTVEAGATMRVNTTGAMEASTLTRNGTFNLEAGTLRTNTIAGSGTFGWGAGTIATLGNNTMGTVDRTDPLGSAAGPVVREGNILNFTGNLSSTTASVVDLGAPLLNNGLRYNQIRVTGTLDLSGADSLVFNLNPYLLRPTSVSSVFTGDWGTLILAHAETITGEFDSITGIGGDFIGWSQLPTEYNSGRTAGSLQLNEWVLEYRTGFGYGPLAGGDALLLHYRVAGTVPEPGSAGLLIAGAALIRMLRRRADNEGPDFFHRRRKMIRRRRSRGRR